MSDVRGPAAPGTFCQSQSAHPAQEWCCTIFACFQQRAWGGQYKQTALRSYNKKTDPSGLTMTATKAAASFRGPGSLLVKLHGAGLWADWETERLPSAAEHSKRTAHTAPQNALAAAGADLSVAASHSHQHITA